MAKESPQTYLGSMLQPSQLKSVLLSLLIVFAQASKVANYLKAPIHGCHVIHSLPFLVHFAVKSAERAGC